MMVLPLLLQAAAAPPAHAAAPWTPVERPTANGTRSVSASAYASNGGGARLAVRCDRVGDPVVSVQFIPAKPLAGGGVQPVSLKFDDGTPMGGNWELMGSGAIEREDAAVNTLTIGIAHARTIRLHTVDASGPSDLTFPGPGSDAAMRRVVAACGFPFGQPWLRQAAAAPAPAATPAP